MNYLNLNKLTPVALALLLAACAAIPPESDTLPQRDIAGAQLAAGIKLAREGWPEARWWTRYNDAQLDALIDAALKDGTSMAVAAARLNTARATLATQHAAEGINVTGDASVNRLRYSPNGLFPPPIGGTWFTDNAVTLRASYDFDLWGKHRAAIAAAVGEINAARADTAQAEQGLSAAVAQTYFRLQADWARLAVLREERSQQVALNELRKKRLDRGLDPITARQTSQGDIALTDRQIAALESQAGQDKEALRALIGGDANALIALKPQALPKTDSAAPTTLGYQLLARRADLQAARWRVEANLSKIESAKAAFYPTVEINASFGLDSIEPGNLLLWQSRAATFMPSISLPIFDSGRLAAQLGTQRAKRDEVIADYNQAVVNAVRDVAQNIIATQGLQAQSRAQSDGQRAADAQLKTATARLKTGLVDRSAQIQAQLAVLGQRELALQLQQARLDADVALIKTLGGGYQAPADPVASAE
ncbi:Outer membrane protein OprM [Andreprevotia sp. IGB-42]|uniref:efflux transporter outer membrane subunit n=1 Tax=Andreprevotia sp. IGB-42 TaxID=2497473 RepID=UPI00135A3591|nr:efflux transporter outer membrane subunit [Andreprevotia sp. IGB-42]KAF0812303.1 Outer membrane protein OprM [Andreprevotia sp. IGB-42]